MYEMSYVLRKPAFCICENNAADRRLCFRYIGSTISLLSQTLEQDTLPPESTGNTQEAVALSQHD